MGGWVGGCVRGRVRVRVHLRVRVRACVCACAGARGCGAVRVCHLVARPHLQPRRAARRLGQEILLLLDVRLPVVEQLARRRHLRGRVGRVRRVGQGRGG